MAEKYRYRCERPARLIFSSVTVKSAPKGIANAELKYNGTFGLEEVDYKAIVALEVEAIKSELGSFSGKAGDYYLACTSGKTAADRVIAHAEFQAQGKTPDEALKIKERAETRAELYRQYPGILMASSKFDVECARLDNGKVIDIDLSTDANRALAAKEYFFPGAYVVPAVAFQGFRRKKVDDKDGVTAFLQNCMFVMKGKKIGGLAPSNKEVFGGFTDYDPTALAPTDGGFEEDAPKAGGGAAFDESLDADVPF
jgi:hypothetical protein